MLEAIAIISFLLLLFFALVPLRAWFTVRGDDLDIPLKQLIGMRIRRVDPFIIINAMRRAREAGIDDADSDCLEAHFLSGSSVNGFIDVLEVGRKAGIVIPFKEACMMYIRNEDLMEEIQRKIKEKGYVQREEA